MEDGTFQNGHEDQRITSRKAKKELSSRKQVNHNKAKNKAVALMGLPPASREVIAYSAGEGEKLESGGESNIPKITEERAGRCCEGTSHDAASLTALKSTIKKAAVKSAKKVRKPSPQGFQGHSTSKLKKNKKMKSDEVNLASDNFKISIKSKSGTEQENVLNEPKATIQKAVIHRYQSSLPKLETRNKGDMSSSKSQEFLQPVVPSITISPSVSAAMCVQPHSTTILKLPPVFVPRDPNKLAPPQVIEPFKASRIFHREKDTRPAPKGFTLPQVTDTSGTSPTKVAEPNGSNSQWLLPPEFT